MSAEQATLDFDLRTESLRKFQEFHEKNPHVYNILESLVRQMLLKGYTRIGINHVCEVARYEHFFVTKDDNSEFQVSNNYRPHYADLLVENNPAWGELIERHRRWAK